MATSLGHCIVKLRGMALRPLAAAACVPSDTTLVTSAPPTAPATAPRGPTHEHAMPSVKIPHVVLAAIADRAVATPGNAHHRV